MIERKILVESGTIGAKSNDIPCKPAVNENRTNERGAAMVIALILIATFIFLATAASRTVSAISAEAQKIEQTRQESARAEYYVSMAEATLKYDVRRVYNDYQIRGKQSELRLGGDGTLPMFDPLAVTDSRPLLNLDDSHSGESPRTATSLYGRLSLWAEQALAVSRTYLDAKVEEKQLIFPEVVEIKSFTEAFRRTMQGESEPIYALRYTVRATSGEFAEIVREDTILLGPVLNEDSPTLVNCSDLELTGAANPANVVWGNSTRLDLNYIRAERLVIYNQSGSIVYNQAVADEVTPRSISFDTNPLTSPTVFIGEAVRGTCQIQVPITVGVTFAQNIAYTVNGMQSVNIIEGENIRYDWNVTDADANYTTSYITYANDPTQFFNNIFSNSITQSGPLVSTTSVLHVRDTRYNNNAEQTAAINITVCRLPRISNFTVTPSTFSEGGNNNMRFDWQTEWASRIRIVRVSDGQVIYTSNDTSGNWTTAQPSATSDYRLEAISDCGAPTALSTVRVIINGNPPCSPPPSFNSFNASPNPVVSGGSQTVRLSWTATGTVDTLTIDGIGAVSGAFIDIPQPQVTTTYVIRAVGCSQSTEAQVTVTVQGNPPISQSSSREIVWQSGYFGCGTGNEIRVASGLPAAPCVVWTVNDTFSLERESGNNYILTFTSVSNADTHPWFRSKRRPSVQIGVFGAIGYGCFESVLNPMCYEDREQYSFFADFGGFDNTPDITPIQFPLTPRSDNTYKFRISLAPQAQKVVIREVGSGANYYTMYYPGYNFGPGDHFDEGDLNYGYPQGTGFQQAVFDVP